MRLSQLQNLCKRDPLGYSDDYRTQAKRFKAELNILKLNPGSENEPFVELLQFICAVVSKSYRDDGEEVVEMVMGLMRDKGEEVRLWSEATAA